MEFSDGGDEASIRPLEEMLEGQVAVLSSGVLGPDEAAGVVSSLFESRLYRPDERTFLLYPERTLPGFLEKNTIADGEALAIPLLRELLEAGDGVHEGDRSHVYPSRGSAMMRVPAPPATASSIRSSEVMTAVAPCSATRASASTFGPMEPVPKWPSADRRRASDTESSRRKRSRGVP